MNKQFRIDIKNAVELATSMKVYPGKIPDKAKYPCIEMSLTGGGRDSNSNLSESNIKEYRLSLVVCSSLASVCYDVEDLLVGAFDNKQLKTDNTRTDIIRHDGTIELYNYNQNLYELTVDLVFKRFL